MNKSDSVYHSLELIEKRITEKLTVENIANSVYFSKDHYQRLFRDVVGESVMEYVTRRKMTLAGRALLETDTAIIDIAMDYGYDSREGFSRSFKAYMGLSPADYRKNNLTAFSQRKERKCFNMSYSKKVDEIIKEINDFIGLTKELANELQKIDTEDKEFWGKVAEHTYLFADRIDSDISKVKSIASHHDEISNGFAIVKIIEDIVFQMNIMGHQTAITAAQSINHRELYLQFSEKYRNLAFNGWQKSKKVYEFLKELSLLIINDMRKTAKEMIQNTINQGKQAVKSFNGSANYIRDEVERVVDLLSSTTVDDMTELFLDDCLFRLQIISFTTKFAMLPNYSDIDAALTGFQENLSATAEYINSIIKPQPSFEADVSLLRTLQDVAYQGNILLFYDRGIIEKLTSEGMLNDVQKTEFQRIDDEICDCICVAVDAERFKSNDNVENIAIIRNIVERFHIIASDLKSLADELGINEYGLLVSATEHKNLADKADNFINEYVKLTG